MTPYQKNSSEVISQILLWNSPTGFIKLTILFKNPGKKTNSTRIYESSSIHDVTATVDMRSWWFLLIEWHSECDRYFFPLLPQSCTPSISNSPFYALSSLTWTHLCTQLLHEVNLHPEKLRVTKFHVGGWF